MTINITDNTRIIDIQKKFRQAYPFLKIEFFDRPHAWSSTVGKAHRYDPEFTIRFIQKIKKNYCLELHPWEKVGSVEEHFSQLFGLYPQVYRRNAYSWIETAGTDELSLDEQNGIGKKSLMEPHVNLWVEREVLL
jgi:hypothetical protein